MKKHKLNRNRPPHPSAIDYSIDLKQLSNTTLYALIQNLNQETKNIPFFTDKEKDVNPVYKFLIQELVKIRLRSDDETDEDNTLNIGLEGFDKTRL